MESMHNNVRTSGMTLHKFTQISWAFSNVVSLTQSYHSRVGQNGGTVLPPVLDRMMQFVATLHIIHIFIEYGD